MKVDIYIASYPLGIDNLFEVGLQIRSLKRSGLQIPTSVIVRY